MSHVKGKFCKREKYRAEITQQAGGTKTNLSPAEILYPNDRPGRKRGQSAPRRRPTALSDVRGRPPRAEIAHGAAKPGGAKRKLSPAEILYPNEWPGAKSSKSAPSGEVRGKLSPAEILYPNDRPGRKGPQGPPRNEAMPEQAEDGEPPPGGRQKAGEIPNTRGGALAPDAPAKFTANEKPTSLSDQRGGPLGRVPRANSNIQQASLVMHGGMDSDERDEPGEASATDNPDIQLAAEKAVEPEVNIKENNLPERVANIFSGDSDKSTYATSLENTFALGASRTAAAIPKALALAGVGIRNELLDALENAYRNSVGAGVDEDDIRNQLVGGPGKPSATIHRRLWRRFSHWKEATARN